MKFAAISLALATYAYAQSSVITSAASAAASVVGSAAISVEAGSSLASSMATGPVPSAAQSASPSGIPVIANTSYGYDCPAGYLLTYGIANATFTNVDLSTAVAYFSNWTGSAPGMITASSGQNETGATRSYIPAGANYTVSEVLVNSTIDMMTGALQQVANSTAPFETQGVTIASAFNDLQVYSNATTGATTVQVFINACASNQELTLLGLVGSLEAAIQYWAAQLTGAVQSASMSGSMSGMSSLASATGVAGGVVSSASAALSSATAAPASALSSITGAPAAALSSATAAPANALSSLTAGIASSLPSLRARGRWL